MGGIAFLEALRKDERLRHTIVFVLTTSNHERDRIACFNLGAAGFALKESIMPHSEKFAQLIQGYWELFEVPR